MAKLNRGLIVSCQAVEGEVLHGLGLMKYFARAAVAGGACGIRANTAQDIRDIRTETDLPIIGIVKRVYDDSDVYITPTRNEVRELLDCGCEVIALDATLRARHGGETLESLVQYIRDSGKDVEIMADCSDFEEAERAYKLGFDYIGSTLRGYTPYTKDVQLPDYAFLEKLVRAFPDRHIIAEGGIWEREQLRKVCATGVYAVVIGSSITRPKDITQRFAEAMQLC